LVIGLAQACALKLSLKRAPSRKLSCDFMRDGALEREHQAFMSFVGLACGLVRFMRGPCGFAFVSFNLISRSPMGNASVTHTLITRVEVTSFDSIGSINFIDFIDFTHNFVTHQVHSVSPRVDVVAMR
jgi:hypothetical protein